MAQREGAQNNQSATEFGRKGMDKRTPQRRADSASEMDGKDSGSNHAGYNTDNEQNQSSER